jgi:hypothetical protein
VNSLIRNRAGGQDGMRPHRSRETLQAIDKHGGPSMNVRDVPDALVTE